MGPSFFCLERQEKHMSILKIKKNERILIVAPHPDDDCISCGGLLALYPGQCDVLLVTDGYDPSMGDPQIAQIRLHEFESAMKAAKVRQYTTLHLTQYQILQHFQAFSQVDLRPYAYIFVPNRYEYHKDHVAVYKTIKKLYKQQKCRGKLCEYEVWTTLRYPTFYLDISSVIQQKKDLISEYRSQTAQLDYASLALGLNAYRGLSRHMPYAEAYYCGKHEREARIRAVKRRIRSFYQH